MITNEINMNCREFKNITLLFIDRELSDELNVAAENHLSTCKSCSLYIQTLNTIYSETAKVLTEKKTDSYFYTRLIARMESDASYSGKRFRHLSYYLQPAFYTLFAFTILFSVLMITGSIKNKQQTITAVVLQNTSSEEQDYLKTIAMNDQTFEEDYINIIEK
jgi:hypothetical protein